MAKVKAYNEDLRQVVHMLVGVAAVLSVLFIGFNSALLLMAGIFLAGFVLANFKILGGKVKFVENFLTLLDRNVPVPGQGAMFYAVGILLSLLFIHPLEFALGVIMLHAVGDAFATIVGKRFKSPLQWNSNKSWSGLAAFTVFGLLVSSFFIPLYAAVLYAVVLGVVESISMQVDDNVTVPIAALVLRGFGI
ncbi:MAG: hypothetical protein V1644_00500 [Candidatus Micrarchaeota archaeon]